jgi:hypothetical protein
MGLPAPSLRGGLTTRIQPPLRKQNLYQGFVIGGRLIECNAQSALLVRRSTSCESSHCKFSRRPLGSAPLSLRHDLPFNPLCPTEPPGNRRRTRSLKDVCFAERRISPSLRRNASQETAIYADLA